MSNTTPSPGNTHPLQPALDRSSRALCTVTDLTEIALQRFESGKRSDARQDSLYRAIVTASVGSVEEAVEATVSGYLTSVDTPAQVVKALDRVVSKRFQTPNTDSIKEIIEGYIGVDPLANLRVKLKTSPFARRGVKQLPGQPTSFEMWTTLNEAQCWSGDEAGAIWNRFVRIRHAFAHQDSSRQLFTNRETHKLRMMTNQDPLDPDLRGFAKQVNSTAAVRLFQRTSNSADPVHNWRLHRAQAVNALLAAAGVISTTVESVADYMQANVSIDRKNFSPLTLNLDMGEWCQFVGDELVKGPQRTDQNADDSEGSSGVVWKLVKYRPGSRR